MKIVIPKGSLSYICKGIILTPKQRQRINDALRSQMPEKQRKAVAANRRILAAKINGYAVANSSLSQFMASREARLVALSMLYLGEGSKWRSGGGPQLGSTNPLIIMLYLDLIRECYGISGNMLRGRVQHRADQDSEKLLTYWSHITGIPKTRFYPCYVDKRTLGKPTLKKDYKGVCTISSAGTHMQLELEQISVIISSALRGIGAAG